MTVLSWDPRFWKSSNFNITYRGQFERIPGSYDGDELEDPTKFIFWIYKNLANDIQLALRIDNITMKK